MNPRWHLQTQHEHALTSVVLSRYFGTFVLFVLLYFCRPFPPTLVLGLEVEGMFQFVF